MRLLRRIHDSVRSTLRYKLLALGLLPIVPLRPGERALGTRVSDEVRTQVLDRGRTWIDRAFVVNDWYISAYEPIVDVEGQRVGMLYAGYLAEVDVNQVTRRMVKLVQHLRRRHAFEVGLSLKATVAVEVNPQQLQQVLVNLLVNAIHALPQHGRHIEMATRDWEGRGVVIHVRDNGHGIRDDCLDKVFNPFYSTKGQGEGSGLGLSVSYGLVRRYGGTITVRSTPGKGAEFSVYLLRTPEFHEDEETLAEQLSAVEAGASCGSGVSSGMS